MNVSTKTIKICGKSLFYKTERECIVSLDFIDNVKKYSCNKSSKCLIGFRLSTNCLVKDNVSDSDLLYTRC